MTFSANAVVNIILVFAALICVIALAVHAIHTRRKDDARNADALRYPILDCSVEYQVCMRLDYTARSARSHVRAYIARKYSDMFDADQRATILRRAIHEAQMSINARNQANTIDDSELIRAV